MGLQRALGLGSYHRLHNFRRAMVRPGRDNLSGIVEIDETYKSSHRRAVWLLDVGSSHPGNARSKPVLSTNIGFRVGGQYMK